mmetsp:Transcript_102614/g.257184  ORF Transcript_102614/g.257184 Transcript_102614/m.257184 type:complete len:128 (-) Transcript_102614:1698-2081(-)
MPISSLVKRMTGEKCCAALEATKAMVRYCGRRVIRGTATSTATQIHVAEEHHRGLSERQSSDKAIPHVIMSRTAPHQGETVGTTSIANLILEFSFRKVAAQDEDMIAQMLAPTGQERTSKLELWVAS